MIPQHIKQMLVSAIECAVSDGARVRIACQAAGISIQSYSRWRKGKLKDERKNAVKHIPRKLTPEEEDIFYQVTTEQRFRELPPEQIVAILLEEGVYYASARTLYRIFAKRNANQIRTESRRPSKSRVPQELIANGPNQIWCWDITWLKTPVKGVFLYAYVIVDIYSRAIIGWSVEAEESDSLAQELFKRIIRYRNVAPKFVHSDNGGPMKGVNLISYLNAMNVNTSYSRPRVSDDNPFIEAWFRTLKYHVSYPKVFKELTHARRWFADFVDWYNNRHRHSGINYVTPSQRHSGEDKKILATRQRTLDKAARLYPERFVNGAKKFVFQEFVALNPSVGMSGKI